jgi:hypothetical protein
VLIAYVLFLLAGLVFGYAAPGPAKLLAFVFPLVLAIAPLLGEGLEAVILARLLLALLVTALGIAAGAVVDWRSARA